MLTYNTQRKKLVLPEYGRNIQKMIDHCLTIEDRQERTLCASSIIDAMRNLFPSLAASDDFRQKLWDHLAIMADFKLDIDYPVEIVKPDSLATQPQPINLPSDRFRYRHYGKYIEQMIEKATSHEEGEERAALELLIANHMKKLMLAVNSDGVEDDKIFKDLAELSHGQIRLSSETTHLHEFKEAPAPATGKKKKKK